MKIQAQLLPRLDRAIAVLSVLVLLPLAAVAQTEIERSAKLDARGSVEIINVSGSVAVTGWDGEMIEITGTLGRGVDELRVEGNGSRVEIEVELPRRGGRDGHADLEVKVPRQASVSVEVVSADVTVLEFGGRLEVETVSGSVEIEGTMREAEVETVSGNIEVDAKTEEISVESVSGNIDLVGSTGQVEAESVSGNLRIDDAEGIRQLEGESVSGRVQLSGSLARGATVELSSHSGSVVLDLPAAVSARFDVQTFSGDVSNDFGPKAERVDRYSPEKQLRFETGGGEARVMIETFSGNVSLRRR